MKFLFLLLATAIAEYDCDVDCVEQLYTAVDAASDGGYEDGDMAVYGYLLYSGFKVAGADGAAWVAEAVSKMAGEDACNNDGSAAKMKSCLESATADELEPILTWLDSDDVTAEEKKGYEFILGAVANQLAPGGEAAGTWDGLSDAAFDSALKVYYVVGAFANYVIPTVESSFDEAGQDTCFARLATSISYSDGDDMVALVADAGENAFGAEGLGHADCFGEGTTATVADLTVTFADGTTAEFADVDALTADIATKKTAATAALETAAEVRAALTDEDGSDASPAAMVSAAVAFVALML